MAHYPREKRPPLTSPSRPTLSKRLKRRGLRPSVFAIPLLFFAILIVTSLLFPVSFLAVATQLNTAILNLFTHGFTVAAFCFLLTCLWAALSPLGKIKIGGEDATPLLSKWNWMAITLTTTVAIGILFWATAEPIYHLNEPGGLDVPPGGETAQRFALSSLYLHSSFPFLFHIPHWSVVNGCPAVSSLHLII